MLNNIINAVMVRLDSLYGDTCEYLREIRESGGEKPTFFIKPLKPTRTRLIGTRGVELYPLDIAYFDFSSRHDAYEVADTLLHNLDHIDIGDGHLLAHNDIEYNVVDEILHVVVTYRVITHAITETAGLQQSAQINIH